MNQHSIFVLMLGFSLTPATAQRIRVAETPAGSDTVKTQVLNEVSLVASRPSARIPLPRFG